MADDFHLKMSSSNEDHGKTTRRALLLLSFVQLAAAVGLAGVALDDPGDWAWLWVPAFAMLASSWSISMRRTWARVVTMAVHVSIALGPLTFVVGTSLHDVPEDFARQTQSVRSHSRGGDPVANWAAGMGKMYLAMLLGVVWLVLAPISGVIAWRIRRRGAQETFLPSGNSSLLRAGLMDGAMTLAFATVALVCIGKPGRQRQRELNGMQLREESSVTSYIQSILKDDQKSQEAALAELTAHAPIILLVQSLNHPDMEVRQALAKLLLEIPDKGWAARHQEPPEALDQSLLFVLMASLNNSDPEVRRAGVQLVKRHNKKLYAEMTRWLIVRDGINEHDTVKIAVLSFYHRAAQDSDPAVRAEAALAILSDAKGTFVPQHPEIIPALSDVIRLGMESEVAAKALREFGQTGESALKGTAESPQ